MSETLRATQFRVRRGRVMRAAGVVAAAALSITFLGACMNLMHRAGAEEEIATADEFGYGPRTSQGGLYRATVEPLEPVRVGHMHTWQLELRDSVGQMVDDATIAVDGGMPQHGHGLPTKPRVTRALGNGAYEVAGMKFNMGGWWVVKFRITASAGSDSVTFNLWL